MLTKYKTICYSNDRRKSKKPTKIKYIAKIAKKVKTDYSVFTFFDLIIYYLVCVQRLNLSTKKLIKASTVARQLLGLLLL